ncbi:MAG: hypothetical protein IJO71_12790 [Microbacterium sp.]|uniref:hypothetical protein n=1 Tax=Microbacterium sp. TaxID=51671 RepID=UPI0025E5A204|nr:hypothetical protein [Microbacterium sp.]MBQ9918060.1 hypothetical protein [Microbacterium sp.]
MTRPVHSSAPPPRRAARAGERLRTRVNRSVIATAAAVLVGGSGLFAVATASATTPADASTDSSAVADLAPTSTPTATPAVAAVVPTEAPDDTPTAPAAEQTEEPVVASGPSDELAAPSAAAIADGDSLARVENGTIWAGDGYFRTSFDYILNEGVDSTEVIVKIWKGTFQYTEEVASDSTGVFTESGHYDHTFRLPEGKYTYAALIYHQGEATPRFDRAYDFTVTADPYGDTFTMLTSDPVQTASDDGDVTLTFGYDIRPDVERNGSTPVVAAYVTDASGERIWFASGEWLTVEGPGVFTDTIRLAPGTYTRHIASSYILHCDCGDVKDITEPYPFTVPEKVDPTPTPTPTPTSTPTVTPTPQPTTTSTATPSPQPSSTTSPAPSASSATVSLSTSTVSRGTAVTVRAGGFTAGEPVEIWLHSTPVKLLSTTASADGTVSATVTIPAGTDIGAHKIEVRGTTTGSVYAALTVIDGLAVTGFDSTSVTWAGVGGSVLLLGGIAALLVALRRAKARA